MKRPTEAFWTELAKLDQSLSTTSYYDLLGVSQAVEDEVLRASYERQVRVLHPDRHAGESDAERKKCLTRVYARMGEAYRTLSQPQLRGEYDEKLALGKTRMDPARKDQGGRAQKADPEHPQARSLHEQALALIERGDLRGAKAKLQLARFYDPGSNAVSLALEQCEVEAEPSETQAPAPSAPAPSANAPLAPAPSANAPLASAPKPPAPKAPAPRAPAQPVPPSIPGSEAQAAEDEFAERIPSRAHKRAPMGQSIKVSCKTWEQVQTFYMHNISRGGMLLRCNDPAPIDSILELTVFTPDREPIQLPGQVVRHVPPRSPGQRPGIGIRFLVIPEPVRERFEAVLEAAGLPQGSHELQSPEPAKGKAQLAIEAAEALIEAGDFRSACQILQEPLRDEPKNQALRSHFHLAAGLMARSRSQEAAAHNHFQRALRCDPDSPMVLRLLRENA